MIKHGQPNIDKWKQRFREASSHMKNFDCLFLNRRLVPDGCYELEDDCDNYKCFDSRQARQRYSELHVYNERDTILFYITKYGFHFYVINRKDRQHLVYVVDVSYTPHQIESKIKALLDKGIPLQEVMEIVEGFFNL
ncbi:MAG: hypothetical protein KAS32_14310 [Candidatus Peribacteraceae bacterium]|nr:hypothetical protein [Candidatus Peribacteraceae bacterium]